jgi:hypothetical protein
MGVQDSSFDDPKLKTFVRKAWGDERAPADLAERVRRMMAEESRAQSVFPRAASAPATETAGGSDGVNARPMRITPEIARRYRPRSPVFGLAIAASLLLTFGSVVLVLYQNASQKILPAGVAVAMVATHDECCRLPDHHLLPGVSPNDLGAIARHIETDLKFPVLAMDPGNGWQFAGAGECPVGPYKSAHLLFRRGGDTMSMFSLPAADFHVETASALTANSDGHLLAGFSEAGGLYCLVQAGPADTISPGQIEQLRDHLERSWTPTMPQAAAGAAAALDGRGNGANDGGELMVDDPRINTSSSTVHAAAD